MNSPKRYHARINCDLPDAMRAAVIERAERELVTISGYIRKALLAQLAHDGIELDPTPLVRNR